MPLVSVVVPIYKTQKLKLRKCIASILSQTHKELEIILVDDGNTQDYVDVLNQYAALDNRVRVISKPNGGVSSARNNGIAAATGEYLSLIDSDDFIEEHFISKLLDAIQDSDLSICGVWEQHFPVWRGWYDVRFFYSKPTRFNGLQYINFSVNKLYKLSYIREDNICFPLDVKLGEDALFLAQYFKKCKSIRCVPDCLYHYVPEAQSAVHGYKPMYWDWEEKVVEQQYEMFHKYPLTSNEEDAMYAWLFRKFNGAFNYYIYNEPFVSEREAYIERIAAHPLYLKLLEQSSQNPHLEKNEQRRMTTWKKYGIEGVFMADRLSVRYRKYQGWLRRMHLIR